MTSQQDILTYWFGDSQDDLEVIRKQSTLWWGKDESVDKYIREQFAGTLEQVETGQLNHWQLTPQGELALILLTDQFSRNCHRNSEAAFALDAVALSICEKGLAEKSDINLRPVERVFFYMPLEHAESLTHQERSVELFRQLQLSIPEAWRETFQQYVDFAERHYEVIQRFGRFPHRNSLLGRTSTPAEQAFLKQPGSAF